MIGVGWTLPSAPASEPLLAKARSADPAQGISPRKRRADAGDHLTGVVGQLAPGEMHHLEASIAQVCVPMQLLTCSVGISVLERAIRLGDGPLLTP